MLIYVNEVLLKNSYFISIIVPLIIIILFRYLTYQNLHTINIDEQYKPSSSTKQTIKMVLLFEFPYGICQIYSISPTNISKSLYRQIEEQFATVFFFIYAYIVNAVIIFKLNRRTNQINPTSETGRVLVQH